jgi:hypothetical protein
MTKHGLDYLIALTKAQEKAQWKRTKVTVLEGFYTTYPSTVLLEKQLEFPIGDGRQVITWSDLIPKPDAGQQRVWGIPGTYKITVEVILPKTVRPKIKTVITTASTPVITTASTLPKKLHKYRKRG